MTDRSSPPAVASAVQSFSLDNGLRIYLREDHRAPLVSAQLWYHVGSSYEPQGHTGLSHAMFALYAFCSPHVAPEAAAERLMLEIGAFRQAAPAKQDLERAKARLLARQMFERDAIDRQAFAIGKQAACGLDPVALDDERQAIEAVTAEQVGQAAYDYLTESRATMTFMHSKESAHA